LIVAQTTKRVFAKRKIKKSKIAKSKAQKRKTAQNIQPKPVISPAMLPMEGISEVQGADGVYLQRNDAMFTAMKHTQGEFSDFFRALRDQAKVLGHRCPECRHLIIPPFMRRCPACNFVEMKPEYVKDTGVMVATPVITVFAPSRFKGQEPFGTGRVFLETADGNLSDTAMLVRVRTTRGTIRPGIYKKGTPVKIAFCDSRQGEMLDIFAVPQNELTPQQLAKSPLFESEIEWGRISEMEFGKPTPQLERTLQQVIAHFQKLAEMIPHSPRATANLANWRRTVTVRTGGGAFGLVLDQGRLQVRKEGVKAPDLVVAIQDPSILLSWLRDSTEPVGDTVKSPALTDLVIEGTLILNKPELETVTRLDRVPRSLRRDNVAVAQ
jgi:uncharacterized OB-fold protein